MSKLVSYLLVTSVFLILPLVVQAQGGCTAPSKAFSTDGTVVSVTLSGKSGSATPYQPANAGYSGDYPAVVMNSMPSSLSGTNNTIVSATNNSARLQFQDLGIVIWPGRYRTSGGTYVNCSSFNWKDIDGWWSDAEAYLDLTLTGSSSSYFEIGTTNNSDGSFDYIQLRDDVQMPSSTLTLTFNWEVGFDPDFVNEKIGHSGSATYSVSIEPSNAVDTDDISVTHESVCDDYSGSITLSISSGYESTSAYRLYRPNGTIYGFFSSGSITIPNNELGLFLNSGNYRFDVTEQETYNTEQNPKAEKTVLIKDPPTVSSLTGTTNICWNDNTKTYSISGTADDYTWVATNGTINSGQGTSSVSVTWNQSASSWGISVTGSNDSDAGSCAGNTVSNNSINVAKDITYYNVSGPSNVCNGETATISLSDSKSSTTYVLYRDGTERTTTTGTGDAISFTGQQPGYTYTIYQRTASCGDYQMTGSVTVNEYSEPSAPTSITGTDEYCAGDLVTATASTGNSTTSWQWQQSTNGGSSYSTVGSETTAIFTNAVSGSVTHLRARYYDANSCPSAWRTFALEMITPPSGYSWNTAPTFICDDDYTKTYSVSGSADSWQWSVTNGTINSGQGNSSVSITWDESKSSHSVRVYGINSSSGDVANCNGSQISRTVDVRDDVNNYTVTGETVCYNQTGTIRLSDTQSGYTYRIFEGGSEVAANKTGTGNAITWSGLGDGTYEVRVEHPTASCGQYSMGSADINVRSQPSAPTNITGTDEYCAGDIVTATASTSNSTSSWQWQQSSNGGSSYSTVGSETSATFTNAVAGNITHLRARYYDSNGCPSAWRTFALEMITAPSGYSISGDNDICQDAGSGQVYTVSGSAGDWTWSATNGTISSGQGSSSVTINWDESKSSHSVRVYGTNSSSGDVANCDGSNANYSVTVRDDVNIYSVTGESVCNGENGDIRLADSQNSYTYRIFQGSTEAAVSKAGTGNALTWTNLSPGTYEVRAQHPTCGYYVMGSASVTELSVPSAPVLSGLDEYCAGSTVSVTAVTGNSAVSWEWAEYDGSWSVVGSETTATFSNPVSGDITQIRGRYIDNNGCASSWRTFSLEMVDAPSGYSFTAGSPTFICDDDYSGHVYTITGSADDWSWSVVGGSITSGGTGTTVTVTWDETAGTHEVRIYGTNNSSGDVAQCDGSLVTLPVDVRDDITEYSVSGNTVCNGEQGTIDLADSQNGYTYRLYQSGSEISGQSIVGDGTSLQWNDFDPGAYEIRVDHPTSSCGIYSMGFGTIIERSVPAAPSISGTNQYCAGDFVSVTGSTGNSTTSWEWAEYDGSWSVVASETTANFTNIVSGDITQLRTRYIDSNGCPSAWQTYNVEMVTPPSGYSISGENDVCVQDWAQNYLAVGTADDWTWSVTNGTITGGQGTNEVTILWDETESSHQVQLYGTNNSTGDVANCDGSQVTYDVILRDDIIFYDVTGTETICIEDDATVELSGSENGKTYVLYIDGSRSTEPTHAKIGTGSGLIWSGLEPYFTYTVVLESVDCGNYQMNNSVTVGEFAKSQPPFIVSSLVRCGPGDFDVEVGSAGSSSEFRFYSFDGSVYTLLGSTSSVADRGTYTLPVTVSQTEFAASYIDANGCESNLADIEIDIQDVPQVTFQSNIVICQEEDGKEINDYLTSSIPANTSYVVEGEIISNKKIFPKLVDDFNQTYPVTYIISNANGCSNTYNLDVYVMGTPEVTITNDSYEVCDQEITHDLADNVVNTDGHTLSYEIDGNPITGSEITLADYTPEAHTITVNIENTVSSYTCDNSSTYEITITEPYDLGLTADDLTYCPGVGSFEVAEPFSGFDGTFTVNGVALTGSTTVTIGSEVIIGDNSLIFTESSTCGTSHPLTITVLEPVSFVVAETVEMCTADGVYNLNGLINQNGITGIWAGSFISGSNFDPIASGPGVFPVRFDYTDPNGCDYQFDVEITVKQSTTPYFSLQAEVCANDVRIPLEATPAGGSFSGNGVIEESGDFYFVPNISMSGSDVDITYTFTETNSCTDNYTRSIRVIEFPTISFENDVVICADQGNVELDQFIVTPDLSTGNGVWSGATIANGQFVQNLATAEDVEYEAEFVFQSNNTCTNSATFTFFYSSVPVVAFEDETVSICIDEEFYDLSDNVINSDGHILGYAVDGVPVVDSNVELATYGEGDFTISVDILNGSGCNNVQTYNLQIQDAGTLTIQNEDLMFCANYGTLDLSEIFEGYEGTFRINGILDDDNLVDVETELNEGDNSLIYTEDNECETSHERIIHIYPSPDFTVADELTICTADGLYDLSQLIDSDSEIVGEWKGSYVENGQFDPLTAGEGTGYEVRYEYTDSNNCDWTYYVSVNVNQSSSPFFNLQAQVCGEDERIEIEPNISGGTISGNGTETEDDQFFFNPDPSMVDTYQEITYTVTNDEGCTSFYSDEIYVTGNPVIEFSENVVICADVDDVELDQFVTTPDLSEGEWSWEGDEVANGKFFTDLTTETDVYLTAEFTYTAENSCSTTETFTFFYSSTPEVTILEEEVAVCLSEGRYDVANNIVNASDYELVYSVDDGTISNGSEVNLSTLGTGLFRVYIDITNDLDCTNRMSYLLRISEAYDIDVTNEDLTFCPSGLDIDLNEIFDGYDVSFQVNGETVSDGIVKYGVELFEGSNPLTVTENTTCETDHSFEITIYQDVELDLGNTIYLCTGDEDFDLNLYNNDEEEIEVSHEVTWSGFGVKASRYFGPAVGAGEYEVTGTYVSDAGCTFTKTRTVIVYRTPELFVGPTIRECSNDGIVDLREGANISSGLVFTHDAAEGYEFDLGLGESGTNRVHVSFTDENSCYVEDFRNVIIDTPTELEPINDFSFCLNEDPIDLSQLSNQNGLRFEASTGLSGELLVPSLVSQPGQIEITATFTNSSSCTSSTTFTATGVETEELEIEAEEVCYGEQIIDLYDYVNIPDGSWEGDEIFDEHYVNIADLDPGVEEYTYTVDNDGNGCALVGIFELTINDLPEAIEVAEAIYTCYNDDTALLQVLNPSVRYTYQWYTESDVLLGSGSELEITNTAQSVYSQATTNNGCTITSSSVEIEISDFDGIIMTDPSGEFIVSGTLVRFDTDIEAENYTWELSDRVTRSDKSPTMVYNYSDTVITVELTVSDDVGCNKLFTTDVEIRDVNNEFTGVMDEEIENNELSFVTDNLTEVKLYPNPTSSQSVTLEFKASVQETMKVSIYDHTSKLLIQTDYQISEGENTININLPDQVNGIYFIQLTSNTMNDFIPGIKN